jgi:hypothetical protein
MLLLPMSLGWTLCLEVGGSGVEEDQLDAFYARTPLTDYFLL